MIRIKYLFSEEYNAILNINGNGMMGYIRIPDINVKLPIYHGTSSEVLEKGAGHLTQTSLPIGGASTHTVLSAHTGNSKSELFTNLVQLKEGDIFYLEVLGETLAYKVDQIKVVEPTDIESLAIELSKDYVTLVTCTPYGINTYRLLVRGERTDYIEVLDGGDANQSIMKNTGFIIMLVCLGLLIVIFIVLKIKQKRRRN
ncbi:MAG: class C sortase [Lachnospiraceae bacterium]